MPGPDSVAHDMTSSSQRWGFAFNGDVGAPVAIGDQRFLRAAEGEHSRQCRNSVLELAEKGEAPRLVVAIELRRDGKLQNVGGAKTKIDVFDIEQAARKSSSNSDEEQGQRNLADHQPLPQPRVPYAGGERPGLLFQRVNQLHTRGAQRW